MSINAAIHMVLRHDEVLGRRDQRIHASVTQVDLHDFSRLCLTYGLGGFHCITKMEAQHRIGQELLKFWREGYGKTYNPDRVRALEVLHLHREFPEVIEVLGRKTAAKPVIIGTSAKPSDKMLDFEAVSSIIDGSGRPAVIQFGTAWGLSPEQLAECDWVLPPIEGQDGYNHLSVRCAAAIIVDRLLRAHPRSGV